jgi:hypothetical protein
MMWVFHIQLNAHSEGLVYDVDIAYLVKCTQ